MQDPLATVGAIYQAFGRGDIPAILAVLAEDVSWESWADNQAQNAGVPWMAARRGRSAVAGFFEVIGRMQVHDFQVLNMMSGGNQVAVEVVFDATPAAGARYRDEEVHLWTFNAEGQVSRFRHYADTAKHIRAAGVSGPL